MESGYHQEPVPEWLAADIAEFGRGLGLSTFALNGRGVAAVVFENGLGLTLERRRGRLCVYMTCPVRPEAGILRELLSLAHPWGRLAGRVRTAYWANQERAAFLVVLPEAAVSVPRINAAFEDVWQAAQGFQAQYRA